MVPVSPDAIAASTSFAANAASIAFNAAPSVAAVFVASYISFIAASVAAAAPPCQTRRRWQISEPSRCHQLTIE